MPFPAKRPEESHFGQPMMGSAERTMKARILEDEEIDEMLEAADADEDLVEAADEVEELPPPPSLPSVFGTYQED